MDISKMWFCQSVGFATWIRTCTSIDTNVYTYTGSNVCVYIYVDNDKMWFVLSVGFTTWRAWEMEWILLISFLGMPEENPVPLYR